ncbi:MAG: UMP kinase [Candidatus Micrarchaeota archaeon]
MQKTIVSLGGSTLYSEGKLDKRFIKTACTAFKEYASKGNQLVVVVGGGSLSGKKADEARANGLSDYYADKAAIEATRENADLVLAELGSAGAGVVTNIDEALPLLKAGKIVVSGGMHPGLTTDSVSVLFAEAICADRLVNVSNVDGIYDSDPKKNPGAKRFDEMTHEQLVELAIKSDDRRARTNFVFDLVAAKLAARSKIPLVFACKRNFTGLDSVKGTVVS